MRTAILASIFAIGLAGGALSADLSDPVWTQAPDRDAWAKAYPTHAAQAGISGAVKLRCSAGADGSLQNCSVASEAPIGEGFGAAALSLASGMQLRRTGQNGQLITGRQVDVPVKFDPDLLRPPTIISAPDWSRMPTSQEMVQYFPSEAHGAAGKVTLDCVVTGRGLLDQCSVVQESPPGHGFGSSALAMSELFMMRPMTVDGRPVGGSRVTIPIHYHAGPDLAAFGEPVRILSAAPWMAAPTSEQFAAAFPKRDLGTIASAHVVLRCQLRSNGGLVECGTISEAPSGKGFGAAARSLTKDFRAVVNRKTDDLRLTRVDVAFDFRDPTEPAPPLEIYDPIWLKRFNPQMLESEYPPAATQAGVKSGDAKVVCTVAHDGTLEDCSVAEESPGGMGFGQLALTAVSVMQMNPWTRQGTPVDGARVAIPIKFVIPDAAPKPAAAPSKP